MSKRPLVTSNLFVKFSRIKTQVRPGVGMKWWTQNNYATLDMQQYADPTKIKGRQIVRRDATVISQNDFSEYDKNNTPVTFYSINKHKSVFNILLITEEIISQWPSRQRWSVPYLDSKFPKQTVHVGVDSKGYGISLSLHEYVYYMQHNKDDAPLYVYEDKIPANFLSEFSVPHLFAKSEVNVNWKSELGHVPPHQWFIMGPPRSGTSLHVDPFNTNAWNALIYGKKRWILFPPKQNGRDTKEILKERKLLEEDEEGECDSVPPLEWIVKNYNLDTLKDMEYYDIVQKDGDVVFIPTGWWHLVLNIENSISITQNYTSKHNLDKVKKAIVEYKKNNSEES